MIIHSIKTHKIVPGKETLYGVLDEYIKTLPNKSILVITSKIVAICEGRVIKINEAKKEDLIKQEAEYYLPLKQNKYSTILTIKRSLLNRTSGIDESNGNGHYIFWPVDPQKTANSVREYLCKRLKKKNIGIIITDSRSVPLRRGATGVALAHSGFDALNNFIGKPDIFGRELKVTISNVMDALAAGAVTVIGESNEQTPIAVIEDIPFIKFRNRSPSKKELEELYIAMENDIFAPVLQSVPWKKGGKFNKLT